VSDGTLRVGPPEPLARNELIQAGPPIDHGLAVAAHGRLVAASMTASSGILLVDPDRPSRRTWLSPHLNPGDVALSPDGRWAATGSWASPLYWRQVKVWDTATGAAVLQPDLGNARVAFSPDGRWLGVGGAGWYRFYRTGSWAPGAAIEHGDQDVRRPLAFHPRAPYRCIA
jgi:hypothetical protein